MTKTSSSHRLSPYDEQRRGGHHQVGFLRLRQVDQSGFPVPSLGVFEESDEAYSGPFQKLSYATAPAALGTNLIRNRMIPRLLRGSVFPCKNFGVPFRKGIFLISTDSLIGLICRDFLDHCFWKGGP